MFPMLNVSDIIYEPMLKKFDEQLLDENGMLRLLPAEVFQKFNFDDFRLWLHFRAAYHVPTLETVQWLKETVGSESVIEIGSGNGWLSNLTGFTATDRKVQDNPDGLLVYSSLRQPRIKYPEWVEHLNASEAITKYRPHTVVAAWVTEFSKTHTAQSSMYGVNEERLLERCKRYILIGSTHIHGNKKILKKKHRVFELPFLVSRTDQARKVGTNKVWIWEN